MFGNTVLLRTNERFAICNKDVKGASIINLDDINAASFADFVYIDQTGVDYLSECFQIFWVLPLRGLRFGPFRVGAWPSNIGALIMKALLSCRVGLPADGPYNQCGVVAPVY